MSQDIHLQLSVLAELEWEPSITAAHIGVAANAGVITLTGQVESYAEKHAAEAAARRVKGVLAVNTLRMAQFRPGENQLNSVRDRLGASMSKLWTVLAICAVMTVVIVAGGYFTVSDDFNRTQCASDNSNCVDVPVAPAATPPPQ